MKLSNRDILLVIGIVVAVIVTLTTLVYKDQSSATKTEPVLPKKTSLHKSASDLIHNLVRKVETPRL